MVIIKSFIAVKILSPILSFYYRYIQRNLKFSPIIGLIIVLIIIFIQKSSEVTFLLKISTAVNIFFELFDFSDKWQFAKNIFIVITIWAAYRYWLNRLSIIKKNPRLAESIIYVLMFLILVEHINLNSPIGKFVEWAVLLAVAYLILAGLYVLNVIIYSIDLSSYRSKPNNVNKCSDYFTDIPISDPKLDEFKRYSFAQRVAETIASRCDPASIVIGIYGVWGGGKSTVLNFIEKELENKDDVICVKFNPWRFEDEIHLLQDFFKILADELGKSISSPNEKIRELLKDYAAILTFTIGGIVQLSPGEVGKSHSSVELSELKKRIEIFLKNESKNIVILIDDIDRLDKKEIQTIFKLVKLSADFDKTTYVLAFDEKMVSEAVGEKYGLGDKEAGRNFIDKIVQVPLNLPKADAISLRDICIKIISETLNKANIYLTEEQRQEFLGKLFIDCLETRIQTPRAAKRYGNALYFSLHLLKGEVNPVDLMLIEGMRIFYPKLYDTVRNNPEIFLKSCMNNDEMNEKINEVAEKGFVGLDNVEIQSAKKLLKVLFPFYNDVKPMGYGSIWEEKVAEEQRIVSTQYFNRYFSYSVPDGDISDIEIDDLIKQSKSETILNIASKIQKLSDRNEDLFILKLKIKAGNLSSETSRKLAIAIAKVGDNFSKSENELFYMTAFSQAGTLISQLINNIPKGNVRFDTTKVILVEESVLFASECFRWITTNKEQDRIFTVEEENELGKIITKRIKQFSQGEPIYKKSPGNALSLLNIWSTYSSREEINQYLAKTLDEKPENAIDLLKCYQPTWFGADGTHKGSLEQRQYDSIKEDVDPDVIYNALCNINGLDLESLKHQETINQPLYDENVAYQFAKIHRSAINKEQDAQNKKEEPGNLSKTENQNSGN
jgi:predicted KAP-like P-loop ATPase